MYKRGPAVLRWLGTVMMKTYSDTTVQTVHFHADGYQLKGQLHLPQRLAPPLVIGSHGFLANSRSPKLLALARQCNRCGLGFFRFDHRGCGESGGSFEAGTSLRGRRDDLIRAIRALRGMGHAQNGVGLFGSSMGGATALAVAMEMPVDALVTYAAPLRSPRADPPAQSSYESDGSAGNRIRFDIRLNASSAHHILILHGDADTVVPLGHGQEIYQQAKRPKRIIIQKGGDHPMSLPAHQKAFIREAVFWFNVCLKNKDQGKTDIPFT